MKTNLLYQMLSSKKLLVTIVAAILSFNCFGLNITTTTTWNIANLDAIFSTPQTWGTWNSGTGTLTMNESIYVKNNSTTFTISEVTVRFDETDHVTVEAGASFILNSFAKLTYNPVTGDYWQGVKGEGDASEPQFDLSNGNNIAPYYTPRNASTVYDADQTLIHFDNAEIERAFTGVQSSDGAILRIEDTRFFDCGVSFKVNSYTHPVATTNPFVENIDLRNACFISDCEINWTTIVSYPWGGSPVGFAAYKGITLTEVYGVHIQGVSINNTNVHNSTGCAERGTGIETFDANFTMHKSGTATYNDPLGGGDGCVSYSGTANAINDISVGVYISESASPVPDPRVNVAITETNFTGIPYGVRLIKGYRILVKDCSFDMTTIHDNVNAFRGASCTLDPYAIFAPETVEILIADNTFTGEPLTTDPKTVSFVNLIDCGTKDNKVYRNTFTINSPNISGNTFKGVFLSDVNSAIEIACNTFTSLHTGIEVASGSDAGTVWDYDGGKELENEFINLLDYDISNLTSTKITYTEDNTTFTPILLNSNGSWDNIAGLENTCADLPCDIWPIGVGISTPSPLGGYSIYPNPVKDNLTIDFDNAFSGTIQLVDILGRVALQQTTHNNFTTQLNINHLAKGMYVVHLTNTEGITSSQKIVITN
jgi:hypothetical protein